MPAWRHDQFLVFDNVVVELVDVSNEVLRFITVHQNGRITRAPHPNLDLDASSWAGQVSTCWLQLYIQGESLM